MDEVTGRLLHGAPLVGRGDALRRPSPIPTSGGVYGWWFRSVPGALDVSRCIARDGATLLYVGISPKAPSANGRRPSRENLRSRIWTHYAGNAEGSTLRKTLGCLLAGDLAIELRRVGSGNRHTFVDGEVRLSEWMDAHALVSWVTCEQPWEVERRLVSTLDLPLNLGGNLDHPAHVYLARLRAQAVQHANSLPVVPNSGIGGAGWPREPLG